jgi:hypothetical protein
LETHKKEKELWAKNHEGREPQPPNDDTTINDDDDEANEEMLGMEDDYAMLQDLMEDMDRMNAEVSSILGKRKRDSVQHHQPQDPYTYTDQEVENWVPSEGWNDGNSLNFGGSF